MMACTFPSFKEKQAHSITDALPYLTESMVVLCAILYLFSRLFYIGSENLREIYCVKIVREDDYFTSDLF